MRKLVIFLAVVAMALVGEPKVLAQRTALDEDSWLVLYNTNPNDTGDDTSAAWKDFYVQQWPGVNVLGLNLPLDETITETQFINSIWV